MASFFVVAICLTYCFRFFICLTHFLKKRLLVFQYVFVMSYNSNIYIYVCVYLRVCIVFVFMYIVLTQKDKRCDHRCCNFRSRVRFHLTWPTSLPTCRCNGDPQLLLLPETFITFSAVMRATFIGTSESWAGGQAGAQVHWEADEKGSGGLLSPWPSCSTRCLIL